MSALTLRATQARKQTDRLACEAWNKRMLDFQGPAQAIADAQLGAMTVILDQAKKAAVKLGDFTALTLPMEGAYSIER